MISSKDAYLNCFAISAIEIVLLFHMHLISVLVSPKHIFHRR